jgi:phage baseplate assembly protein W
MSLADRKTIQKKKTELYSDFLNNFDKNPFTGYLGKITNEDSVKQSLKNLVLTGYGERFYNVNKGTSIGDMIFGQSGTLIFSELQVIASDVKQKLSQLEPRAIIHDVTFIEPETNFDRNGVVIRIVFSVANIIDEQITLDIFVERVR